MSKITLLAADLASRVAAMKTDSPTNNAALMEGMIREAVNEMSEEIKRLRTGLSKVASNIGNGSAASPECSLEFLCDAVPEEVGPHCRACHIEIKQLRQQLAAAAQRAERAEAKAAFYQSKQVMVQISKDLDSERLQQENTQLRADKEKAEKACAEMRGAALHWKGFYERELAQAEQSAKRCKQNNDTHGWNFYKGRCGGLIAQDISLTRLKDLANATDCGKGYVKAESLTCLKCGDGNTALYCLNCAREEHTKLDDIDELLTLLQSIVSAQHNAKGWVERLEAMRGDSARIGQGAPEGD